MISGRCPICSRTFELQAISDWPCFPFCSERCRVVDLGRWIDGAYAIPTAERPRDQEDDEESALDETE